MATAGAGLFGHVGEFNAERENFQSYVERMEMFFTANNIVETAGEENEAGNQLVRERKRAIFLTEIGPEVYSTLSNLLAPAKPKDTSLTNMVQALEKHFNPAPLEIAESFHFGTRSQQPSESISEYIVVLKKLSIHCNFGEFLNRALRDRFVCGLNNFKIQNKLLNTENLTFDKACLIAKSMEMAERNTQEFHPATSTNTTGFGDGTVNQIQTTKRDGQVCYRCGGNHNAKNCRFKTAKCFKCTKIGHIASVCRSKTHKEDKSGLPQGRTDRGNIQNLSVSNSNDNVDSDELGIYSLYAVGSENTSSDRYNVELSINGVACGMEIDTAADFSIMSKSIYDQKFPQFPLYPSAVKLKTYTGETLQVSGEMKCEVVYQNKTYMLPIVIANYEGKPTLLGKNWLAHIKLDWGRIFSVRSSEQSNARRQLEELLSKYKSIFEDSYEGMKGFEAHITLKEGVRPVFVKPRKVPYALKEAVETELEKLERHGVIEKTERAMWASPVVVVPKADKSMRLCGDYKVTINQFVQDEQYPLPTTQDLYTVLTGSKVFSKLDLSHAYAQLSVDKESQKYLTINTHKGLYSYTKLPYGVKSAPKIFQSKMDQILQGVEKCVCKQDDILIGGDDWKENLKILAEVLERLDKHNVHLKQSKCEFLKPEVVYLGLKINEKGLHPVDEKVEAVRKAPAPSNVSELRSFLGMVQYYHSFLPNLATNLAPLHELLKKNVLWEWTPECQRAYDVCKQSLTSDTLLVHYDLHRDLRLACDASSYGLGAVLSHVMDDGQEKPIAYASRTLSSSEKNYAQIEREALSIIFWG